MSSVTGEQVQLSIFGESHGPAIGCVIDGLPAGIPVNLDAIYKDMARRAPGRDKTATPRLEKDIPHIRSGVLNGLTTGAPLAWRLPMKIPAAVTMAMWRWYLDPLTAITRPM